MTNPSTNYTISHEEHCRNMERQVANAQAYRDIHAPKAEAEKTQALSDLYTPAGLKYSTLAKKRQPPERPNPMPENRPDVSKVVLTKYLEYRDRFFEIKKDRANKQHDVKKLNQELEIAKKELNALKNEEKSADLKFSTLLLILDDSGFSREEIANLKKENL